MDLGFDAAGYETLWQCEIDKRLRSVLKRHWPLVKQYDDVSTVKGNKVAPVDVISFGSPCQDLSIAGKRSGLTGSRSGLFHQTIRIIKEMRKATNNEYPKAVVWENVPGALSSSKGDDFATVIDELAKSGAVDIQWRVLDAQHFGVPQRRRRIFLIGIYSRDINAGEILAEQQSSTGDSEAGESARQEATPTATAGAGEGCWWDGSQVTHAITASLAAKGQMVPEDQRMFAVLQRNTKASEAGKPIIMVDRQGKPGGGKGPLLSPDISLTLQTSNQQVLFVKTRRAQNSDDDEAWERNRPAPTLNSFDNASESRATILCVTGSNTHALTAEGHDASEDGTGRGTPIVAFDEYNSTTSPIHQSLRAGTKQSTGVVTGYSVRRLTPRECERLMGWPDDHTRWDAEGKELADSPRYKACGNGVATPVAAYVARRLADVLEPTRNA